MKVVKFFINAVPGLFLILWGILFLPGVGGVFPYVVLSGSMEPVIRTGGIAYVSTRDKNPEVGDIVMLQKAGSLVTHRVVHMENGQYFTKGDANASVDVTTSSPDQIMGKVVFSLPGLGYVVSFFQSWYGIVLAVCAAVCSGGLCFRKGERREIARKMK